TTTYTVTIYEGGCSGQSTFVVTVLSVPNVDFRVSETQGCGSLTVSFENLSQNATLMRWDFGDGSPVSNALHPRHTYSRPGNYTVTLTTTSTQACPISKTHSEVITVYEPFQARMTVSPSINRQFILPEQAEITFKDSSNGAIRWLWVFGDGRTSTEINVTHRYETAGTYYPMLIVQNAIGCADTAVVGPVLVLEPTLNIPNVFTPNGDGVNDVFRVEYFGTKSYSVQIFDRWGNQLFETNNTTLFWDGKYNRSDVPEGVYYYVVKIGEKIYQGNVTVVR
ncbi:MAG: PKD domain-containing protein, partial [Bacteroidia bacterium]|nr:PKD domain-containing protein [Bacteroidia bacterium]